MSLINFNEFWQFKWIHRNYQKIYYKEMLPMVEIHEYDEMMKSIKRCYSRCSIDKKDKTKIIKKECAHTDCLYQIERNQLILKFLRSTGARVSEVSNLKIHELSPTETKGLFHKSYTKRHKSRVFTLDPDYHEDLWIFIKK